MKSSIKMLCVLIAAALVTTAFAMLESPTKENQWPAAEQPAGKDRPESHRSATIKEGELTSIQVQKLIEMLRDGLTVPGSDLRISDLEGRRERRTGLDRGLLDPLSYPAGCTIPVVVIPSPETVENQPDLLDKAVKDLNIMCRIFDEQLGLPVPGWSNPLKQVIYLNYRSQSTDLLSGFLRSESRNTKAMYIEGYGAFFYMNVPFELIGPPQEAGKAGEVPREAADEAWRQAEQQLYGPTDASKDADSGRKYDPQVVEKFKSKLIETLKQAANIRCLKPDELAVVAVRDSRWTGAPPIMTFRAKKSDVDAWAKGDLAFEQFREKLLILTYPDH